MQAIALFSLLTLAIIAIIAQEAQSAKIMCADQVEDFTSSQFEILSSLDYFVQNGSTACRDTSCLPVVPFDDDGEIGNATGFLLFKSPWGWGERIILTWNDTEVEGTAYFYMRYYILDVHNEATGKPPTAYFSHQYCQGSDRGFCELETDEYEQSRTWEELCVKVTPGIPVEPIRFVHFDNNGAGKSFMTIDKIIYVRLEPNEAELLCNRNETEAIKQYCSANPPTPKPTLPPPQTGPPAELPLVTCIDDMEDLQESGWIFTSDYPDYNGEWWSYCSRQQDSCMSFTSEDAYGVFELKPPHVGHMKLEWLDAQASSSGTAYFYVRYYLEEDDIEYEIDPYFKPYGAAFSHDNCNDTSSNDCRFAKNRGIFLERCMEVKQDTLPQRALYFFTYTGINYRFAIDKLIYVRLDASEPKLKCSSSETEEIKQYCNWSSPTSEPPSTTTIVSSSTDSTSENSTPTTTEAPEDTTSTETSTTIASSSPPTAPASPLPVSTTSIGTVSTSSSTPTSLPPTSTTPIAEPTIETEWVDNDKDLRGYNWVTSNSLKYAQHSTDLPFTICRNLTEASGLFYFHGKPQDGSSVQEIKRPQYIEPFEATLYIRYYIHHTSPTDPHRYYVSPVEDKFGGVHYLDSTSDFRWKEALLHIDVDDRDESSVSFRIGTTNDDEDEDFFVIDKIVFTCRF